MSESKITTWIAFSCPHVPLQCDAAIDWMLGQISDLSPDVIIHLGDGHEADSASRWPSEYDWSLEDEFVGHNNLLKNVRKAYPPAQRVFIEGNHDSNLLALNRFDKKIRGLCDYRRWESELDRYWSQPTEYVYKRDKGCFRIGQVTFFHGWEAGVSADEMQAYILGVPYGLTISGHTHRPLEVTQGHRTKGVPLPYHYANAGCMRDISDVPYMSRKRRHGWGQAVVVGEAESWRYTESLMPQTAMWSAETRIYKMFDD